MPFMLHAAPNAAALSAIVGDDLSFQISQSYGGGGVQWIRVTWSNREIIMERMDDDLAWSVVDPALHDAIGTGRTPEDALRAALVKRVQRLVPRPDSGDDLV